MNVVVFGESGSGKSSTVNLILKQNAAVVSDKAVGCTFEFQKYAAAEGYNLYDTVGLSEGNKGTMIQSTAVSQLINLLKSLEDGVSLLVFVMEKGRIKKSLDENYKLFVEAICMNKVPVVLVITHCEMDEVPKKWWDENKIHFDKYGMKFNAVVCGCTMNPEKAPPMMRPMIKNLNETTLAQLNEAIQANMMNPGWKVKGGWRTWFETIIRAIAKILCAFFGFGLFSSWFGDEEPSFQDRLYTYFLRQGYEVLVARQMANDIANSV